MREPGSADEHRAGAWILRIRAEPPSFAARTVGVATSLVLFVVVSRLGGPPPEESLDAFCGGGGG